MKYYIIAGEASGDLHGSNLVQQLAMADTQASFKGIGGDKMKAANVELLFGLERLAFMGFKLSTDCYYLNRLSRLQPKDGKMV